VEENFQRFGTNAVPDAKTPAEAKAKIRQAIVRMRALEEAGKQARDFAQDLFAITNVQPQNLEKLAKDKGLPVGETAPFDRQQGPRDLDVGPDFAQAAFQLTAEDPFAPPIKGQDTVYVIALATRIPSRVPPLEEIKEQVTGDYKRMEAMRLARDAGTAFYQTVTNGLAQGKSFSAVCNEANKKAVEVPPFSLSTRTLPDDIEEQVGLNQLKQLAFSTPPGSTSAFQASVGGGLILYVKNKVPMDEAKMRADLPAFVNYVRQTRQNEAFGDWFRREAERGLRNTPLAHPQPPVMGSGEAKS
jgi:hypothetical protein